MSLASVPKDFGVRGSTLDTWNMIRAEEWDWFNWVIICKRRLVELMENDVSALPQHSENSWERLAKHSVAMQSTRTPECCNLRYANSVSFLLGDRNKKNEGNNSSKIKGTKEKQYLCQHKCVNNNSTITKTSVCEGETE